MFKQNDTTLNFLLYFCIVKMTQRKFTQTFLTNKFLITPYNYDNFSNNNQNRE